MYEVIVLTGEFTEDRVRYDNLAEAMDTFSKWVSAIAADVRLDEGQGETLTVKITKSEEIIKVVI